MSEQRICETGKWSVGTGKVSTLDSVCMTSETGRIADCGGDRLEQGCW